MYPKSFLSSMKLKEDCLNILGLKGPFFPQNTQLFLGNPGPRILWSGYARSAIYQSGFIIDLLDCPINNENSD